MLTTASFNNILHIFDRIIQRFAWHPEATDANYPERFFAVRGHWRQPAGDTSLQKDIDLVLHQGAGRRCRPSGMAAAEPRRKPSD